MSKRLDARINLRVTQDTYDAYQEAAELLGIEPAALVRQFVDGGVPAMQAIAQTARAAQAGRVGQGAGLLVRLMEAAVAQGQLGLEQSLAIEEEVREVERKRAVGE